MKVAIIGCGWLGKALAHALKAQSIDVLGTGQSEASVSALNALNIDALQLSLPLTEALSPLSLTTLSQYNVWVIAITPQLRKGETNYPEKIQDIMSLATSCQVARVILVSSTAVLNGLHNDIDESASLNLAAPKVDILSRAEMTVITATNEHLQSAVLRLSGLVGEDRHPGRFFKLDKLYSDGLAPVNLIHQKDAVGLLVNMIQCEEISGVYHGVSMTKASKHEFYREAARAIGLKEPRFDLAKDSAQAKRIFGEDTRKRLNYQYQLPDLMHWLEHS
ncbi:NAD(P)-dependent oxidoreductase [Thalassotalea loyana]|uniref:NAD(P)-dependent oxidoreductase n=1 Tax=Thalassotalea loyana TaxID=280483 RepID=A0ABQ6HGZ6_9GAMM|nr:SDR family NAD(P)-dependent oxidoreductase [Thalassotalea loyana]GLX87383.1 NAD(P)-dependent oxidoreductase [Thalassotalea loyana]